MSEFPQPNADGVYAGPNTGQWLPDADGAGYLPGARRLPLAPPLCELCRNLVVGMGTLCADCISDLT